jgi:phage terminase large subunit-like protein
MKKALKKKSQVLKKNIIEESLWNKEARKEQLMPMEPWAIWLLLAGRGFGKTRAGAQAILKIITENKNLRIGILAETLLEAKNIMIEGVSGLLTLTKLKYTYKFHYKKIFFPNNNICEIFGADKYNKLRGFAFDWIWIDEFCKFSNSSEVLEQCFMCLRQGVSKMIITTTPQPCKALEHLMQRNDIYITRGTSYENYVLSSNFKKNLNDLADSDFGQQEILGQIINKALWNKSDIIYKEPNKIIRYILGIDPAIINGVTGIILIGLDTDEYIYVLNDYSIRNCKEWITVVRNLIEQYEDLELAIEINQGGLMIEQILNIYNISNRLYKCRATLSKKERAMPIYALYKKEEIFHLRVFVDLEQEMLFHPRDRVDALVWAVYCARYQKRGDFFII